MSAGAACNTCACIHALLCRWQSSFAAAGRKRSAPTINDPYIRLILDRCLPAEVESRLCKEPLDRLMQEVIAVRTVVIDETLLEWTKEGINQVGGGTLCSHALTLLHC